MENLIEQKFKELEVRIEKLEKTTKTAKIAKIEKTTSIFNDKKKELNYSQFAADLDELIAHRVDEDCKGLIIAGGFIKIKEGEKVKTPRWTSISEIETEEEFQKYIMRNKAEDISDFCSQFSSKEKLSIIRILITNGPLSQSELSNKIGISQGQFYHYSKDLIGYGLIMREKQDQYNITRKGHLFSISFLTSINTFLKMI